MRIITLTIILCLLPATGFAAGKVKPPREVDWPFDGITGKVDKQSAQRGYQVFREVCAACHSLKRVYYRNLLAIGFSEAEVKAIAAEYEIEDGPDEAGDMFFRPGRPSDRMKSPYPNKQAAMAANAGAYPPDQSLIIKARKNGANYVYSLLTGYDETPPEGMKLSGALHYNPYFPGGKIAMAAPLTDGLVEYQDGTEATVEQMSYDVVNFLQWAAEPEMEVRKQTGIKTMIFLVVFTVFFYIAKKRIWSRLQDEN